MSTSVCMTTSVPIWNKTSPSHGLDQFEWAWYSSRERWGISLEGEGAMAGTVEDQLRAMYPPEQLRQLDAVRQALKDNPKALDTHSREVRVKPGEATE